jgi:hypothetical protein
MFFSKSFIAVRHDDIRQKSGILKSERVEKALAQLL